jgi:hypothetical protein
LSQRDHASILEFLKQGRWFGGLPESLQGLIMRHSIFRSYRHASEAQGFAAEEWLLSRLRGIAAMERSSVPGRDPVPTAFPCHKRTWQRWSVYADRSST